jgi:hypothetical protein
MSRKFTAVERKWGGSWGLLGPIADFPDTPDWWWEILSKDAQRILVEAAIKQRIEVGNFVMGQLKENIAVWQKVMGTMKTQR